MASKRQERKRIRGGGLSRPQRRALQRLESKMAVYKIGISDSKSASAYKQPGSMKCW